MWPPHRPTHPTRTCPFTSPRGRRRTWNGDCRPPGVLERDRFSESVEEAVAVIQDDRSDDDGHGQPVDQAIRRGLADDLAAPHDVHVLVPAAIWACSIASATLST